MNRVKYGIQHSVLDGISMKRESNQQGFVMTLVVLLVGSIIGVTVIQTSLSSLNRLQLSQDALHGEALTFQRETCIQEALIQMKWDDEYLGGTLALSGGDCDISVSGPGNTRTLSVTSVINNHQDLTEINVTLDPFGVVSFN